MILVVGATGKTGSAVVGELTGRGWPTRAMAHSSVPKGWAESAGPSGRGDSDIVVGSFEDPPSLDAAVAGCDAVYLVSPPGPAQRVQERAVIEATLRAGTGAHLVKIGSLGMGHPAAGRIGAQHDAIRRDLAESGLPWTVLALNQLSHNLFLYADAVLGHGVLPVPAGDARISWLAVADVARVAAEVLTTPGHVGRTYELTGPQALHHAEVAAMLAAAVGRDVGYVDIPPETAFAAMTGIGLPEWTAHGLVETNEFYRTGGGQVVTDAVEQLGGSTATALPDFIDQHFGAMAGSSSS
jgi:uncharacterized protein YbjT (DUF2867 family)